MRPGQLLHFPQPPVSVLACIKANGSRNLIELNDSESRGFSYSGLQCYTRSALPPQVNLVAMLERSMRSTRASVAAIEERVAALELRLGAGGGTYRLPPDAASAGAPSPLPSVYAASPAREDPYQGSGRAEAAYPASPVQDITHVERGEAEQGAAWTSVLSSLSCEGCCVGSRVCRAGIKFAHGCCVRTEV